MTTHVQQVQHSGSGTSVTATISTTSGNVLLVGVLGVFGSSATLSSVTDSSGSNTWNYSTATSNNNPPAAVVQDQNSNWYLTAVAWSRTTAAVTTVTVNFSASSGFAELYVEEFSGVPAGSVATGVGDTTDNTSPGSAWTSKSLQVVSGSPVLVAASPTGSNFSGVSTSGYTLAAGSVGAWGITTASGSTSCAFTGTPTTVAGDTIFALGLLTTSPPVQAQAIRARLPQQPAGLTAIRGRTSSSQGAPVRNPVTGPVFYPARQAIRARLPQQPAGFGAARGRVTSSPGAPVRNPVPGPVFRQKPAPVRFTLPSWQPRAGRIGSSFGAPVQNPAHGPPVYAPPGPVRARLPELQPRAGRVASNAGSPARNPVQGPVFIQKAWPVQAQDPLPRRGRVYASALPPVVVPPVFAGPPLNPQGLVRARIAQPFSKGRVSSGAGVPVRNPVAGPVFRQATSPAQSRRPLPLRGRVASNPGAPVQNPAPTTTGPVFYPRNSAAPRQPLPRRGTCRAIRFGPLPANPGTGPVFTQATSPARARTPLPPRGRTASSAGAPVRNPSPGPAFYPALSPAKARTPLPPRGRTASNPGGPVRNPLPPNVGPVFFLATSPSRIRPSLPPRGRVSANPGAPVHNPGRGPAVTPLRGPVRAPVPQPFSKGRASGNPGTPAPAVAPVYPLHGPVRIRPALPPRGRTSGNPGIPVTLPPVPAPVYPLHGPVMARRPLPPHGRAITGNPGAPVSNPHTGPVFRQLNWPTRTRIPQNAPRGRTAGNPGGPVANIPFATLRFRTGTPYFQWATGTPGFQWATGEPEAG